MKLPPPNMFERGLAYIAPRRARESYQTRMAFFQTGQYQGARRDKTSLKSWAPSAGSADADSIGDLEDLRSRSRDLVRNAPIARGARNTFRVNVVGSGLRVQSQLEREMLNLTDDEAEAWEDKAEVLFDLWAKSKFADVTGEQNFYELQSLAFTSAFESGDVFAVRRNKATASFVGLCLQMLEADRVCTPTDLSLTSNIRDGVELDKDGAKSAIYVRNRHPGDEQFVGTFTPEAWSKVSAKGAGTGESLFLHLFERERVGQTRGIPSLAPVIEDLKQLDRYAEAELMAAVVSAFFTVFVKNDNGTGDVVGEAMPDGSTLPAGQMALGSGSIVDLGAGESIDIANPNRPNANFDPFFLAIVRKIGMGLGIPYEVLIMHFTASYSASRAALETAWQFFTDRRVWLSRNFCQPVYEWFLYEAVARKLIDAPGFFDDPIKRAAWCGAVWIGDARIVLDPLKEANAEEKWMTMGVKTLEQVTINQTGGDWNRNQEQRGREVKRRRDLDLETNLPAETPLVIEPDKGGSDVESA